MLKDFKNLRELDHFHQIGRYAQLVGALLTVGPTLSAIMRSVTDTIGPNPLLDPLPVFSPTGFAFRHPVWVAVASAPLGIAAVVVGTQFLSKRPSAWLAMKRLCLVGACLCLLQAALFVLSASLIHGYPMIVGFAIVSALGCSFFAFIL